MDRPRIITWNWRAVFDHQTLITAQRLLTGNMLVRITMNRGEKVSATAEFKNGYRAKCAVPGTYSQCAGDFYIAPDAKEASEGPLRIGLSHFSCSCSASKSAPCAHEAALLMHWEKERGSFTFRETPSEKELREKREALASTASAPAPASKASASAAVPVRSPAFSRSEALSIRSFYPNLSLPPHLYYNLDQILETCRCTEAELKKGAALLADPPLISLTPSIGFAPDGEQTLSCKLSLDTYQIRFTLEQNRLIKSACTRCRINYQEKNTTRPPFFCSHQLVAFRHVIDYICQFRPGDATDKNTNTLISFLGSKAPSAPELKRNPTIEITPAIRFHANSSIPFLVILVRQGKGAFTECFRPIRIAEAMEDKSPLFLYGAACIDFERNTLTPESLPVLDFIRFANRSLSRLKARRDYQTVHYSDDALPLVDSILEHFYALTCGQILPVVADNSSRVIDHLQVGPFEGMIPLSLSLSEKNEQPVLLLEGMLPSLNEGSESVYLLSSDRRHLQRLEKQDEKLFSIFHGAADSLGSFQYVIGQNRLMYFCHELIPVIKSNPLFLLRDFTPDGFMDSIPEEASFSYYLTYDHQAGYYHCRIVVRYGTQEFNYPYAGEAPNLRDLVHETQVSQIVQRFFPDFDRSSGTFMCPVSDDSLFRILHDALPQLELCGKVFASEDFPELHLRSIGPVYLDVGIQSDLIHVSFLSEDLSREELLALLSSYQRKQHFHRLRSGDFIDLDEAQSSLDELSSLMELLDLSQEDVIEDNAFLPKSRAAYVNAVMLTHRQMMRSRDEHFRQLVDDFEQIRNSVFEVPESLRSVMRPYQVAGYSWLRMLAHAGFGGILADDMGLGKTLQMLSVLLAMREEGAVDPYLIICPASLVYNWKEEARRFTPALSVTTLTGTVTAREQVLTNLKAGTGTTDLYIASYDVVRRDIALLSSIHFHVIVLDEAQYIKTTRANITKAVKILDATNRFALTGTPIENRLSELWSIFDFLMPGFLFSAETFHTRFDIPITQSKDPASTELLAHMTAPFILRRLKSDVLLELPEKLEEVRTAVFEGEQRKLYDAQVAVLRRLVDSPDASKKRFDILTALLQLRQICCDPSLLFENYQGESAKRTACLDLVESAIDGGHRILLFSQFTSMLALLAEDLSKAGIPYYELTGSTPKEERIRLVHDFNVGEVPVFLISLKAGGTGLNLVGADVVIHYDPWWNLAAQNQATDRAHRIGQQRQVTVFKLIAAGTIEEKIVELQEAKKDLANAILEGRNESLLTLSHDELLSLLT